MQTEMSYEGTSRRTPFDYALAFIFIGLYLWLRLWSAWWQNRWVGFALGAAYALILLVRDWGRVGSDIHAKGLHLGCSVLFFLVAAVSFASFFRGGTGGDGFVGFIMFAFGVHAAYRYCLVSKQDRVNLATKI